MDKNADYVDPLSYLGFGFIELGTLTPKAQAGNLKPRLFRLAKERSLINRMGFNNKGIDHAVKKIKNSNSKAVIGLSIGKSFDTPLDKAVEDYLFCLERAYPVCDYIAVNISSPNTKDLRKLESEKYFSNLISALSGEELFEISNKTLISFRNFLGTTFPIIASGGVMSREHFEKKLELGADLVQIYTGMIYKGPALVKDILNS